MRPSVGSSTQIVIRSYAVFCQLFRWTGLWLFPGAILIIPAIVWFAKVQGALNRYWEDAPRVTVSATA